MPSPIDDARTIAALVGPVSSWVPEHLSEPDPWIAHVPFAFWLVDALRPRTVVELGTQSGNSYLAFCQAVKRLQLTAACFAVDTWEGDEHTGFYGDEVLSRLSTYHDRAYGAFSRLVRTTFDAAAPNFAGGSIDLLHIDGLHRYEAVAGDFNTWLPKLSDRAVVLFHDANVREKDFGVWRLWDELCERYPHFLFLHSHGLGVLGVGTDLPPRVQELFAAGRDPDRTRGIRDYFWRLGDTTLERFHLARDVARLSADVEFHRREIARITGQVAFRDSEIARISHEVAWRDEHLTRLSGEHARLMADIAARDAEIARIGGELGFRNGVVAGLTAEVARRDEALNAILNSRSWRLLAPLRALYARLRAGTLRPELLWQQGRRAAGYWRRHGLRATVRRASRGLLELDRTYMEGTVTPAEPAPAALPAPSSGVSPSELTYTPLVSVIMPVHDVPEEYLRLAIESVRTQRYPHWELCIADDASSQPHVRAVLDGYARLDPRVRVVYREQNGNIAAATNSALDLASGEFVAFLDHDDELTPDALRACVAVLNAKPDVDVVYSDLALISADGNARVDFFKPDWSPEFFRGVMYVGHLLFVRRALVDTAGRLDSRFDGVQDFELMLRLSEHTDRIEHVREILYHWRSIPGSIASGVEAKPQASSRQVLAVNEHLRRLGIPATAVVHPRIPHRVILAPQPREQERKVSVVVSCRGPERTRRSIASMRGKTAIRDIEWILVNPEDGEVGLEPGEARTVVSLDANAGRSQLLHRAATRATGDYLIFVDAGTEAASDEWLEQLLFYLDLPQVGAVGPALVRADGTVQAGGLGVLAADVPVRALLHGQPADGDGYFGALACTREVSAVAAVCLGIRRALYDRLGGFDRFLLESLFDVDLCLRARERGYRNLHVATCRFIDHVGALQDGWSDAFEGAVLGDVWQQQLAAGDPFFNPRSAMAWPADR